MADARYDLRIEDIAYLRHGDHALLARLYQPRGAGPFPAIVEVHGGAWVNSDRLNNEGSMSLDFRMPPEAGYPASAQDINFGIRWLKAHAAEYGTTPAQVGGFGTSSGGHQILLAALRPHDARYAALPGPVGVDASLAFVISAWGVIDPPGRYALAQARGNQAMLDNHHKFWGDVAAMEEGSPPHILARGEKVSLPPALIFQGTADEWVPTATAEGLADAWRRAGGAADLALYEGERHTFMREHPTSPNSRAALQRVQEFIHRHGR